MDMINSEAVSVPWGEELFTGGGGGGSFKGGFDLATAYQKGDTVAWNGSTFQATQSVGGSLPGPSFVGYATTNATGLFSFPGGVQAGDIVVFLGYLAGPPYNGTTAGYGVGTHLPVVNPPVGGARLQNAEYETSFADGVGHTVGINISMYALTAADITAGGLTIPTSQGEVSTGPAYTDFNAQMYVFRTVYVGTQSPDPSNFVIDPKSDLTVGFGPLLTPSDSAFVLANVISLIETGGSVSSGGVLTDEHVVTVSGQYSVDTGYAALPPTFYTPTLTYAVTNPGLPVSNPFGINFLLLDARYPSYSPDWVLVANRLPQAIVNQPDTSFGIGYDSVIMGRESCGFGDFVFVEGDFNVAIGNTDVQSDRAIAITGVVDKNSDYAIAINARAGGQSAVAIGGNALADGAIALGSTYAIPTGADFAIAIGNAALLDGIESIIIGDASYAVNNSPNVVAIGFSAGVQNDSGNSVSIGFNSTVRYTSPSAIGIGDNVLIQSSSGAIAIGQDAKVDTSNGSIAIGRGALAVGANVVAIGDFALSSSQSGANGNTAIGTNSLVSLTTGQYNTALGAFSLGSLDSGTHNTVIGEESALDLIDGNYNTFLGQNTGNGHTLLHGSYNTFVGCLTSVSSDVSGALVIGCSSAGIGAIAGADEAIAIGGSVVASGAAAVAMGSGASSAGVGAVAIGLSSQTNGNNSVAVGRTATATAVNALALGSSAAASGIGSVAIGCDSTGTAASASSADEIRLGTSNHSIFVDGPANFGGDIGFHGHGPVAQSAHPTTLADVIAILSAHGLCA